MKKLYLIASLLFSILVNSQETIKVNFNGQENEFTISKSEFYISYSSESKISLKEKIPEKNFINIMDETALIFNDKYFGDFKKRKSHLMEEFDNQLLNVSPVLIYEDGTKQICVNEISIKVSNENVLDSLFREYSYTKSNVEFDKNQFIIKIFDLNTEELFSLINNLQLEKDIVFAEPNFIRLLKPHTNDPQYNNQWSINNTGYLGGNVDADMDVDGAWVLGTGQNVTVAVIDEGVDLNHADLTSNLVLGFDATGNNSNGAPNSFSDDGHGTSCAGIIAAEANNNEGIAGIAYNAKIMPIRIAFSNGLALGNPNRAWITTDNWIMTGINWAVSNGADVLSNSWGGGSPSATITNAINNAVNNGRNGKGCTVLFSTGNNDTDVSYPATLPNVIAVGASSMCDERKSLTSCDGEISWGSNFGTNIDLVAPGVKIWTTDLTGSNGYSNNDYVSNFNGTSSACPNVAGVVAIVLSINPNMMQTEVRKIIESTVDKVSGYSYSNVTGKLNGTWNNEVGYGRVNALKAALKAYQLKITGPDSFCTSSSFSVNIPTGATVSWQVGSGLSVSTSQNTATVTATGTGFSSWIKAQVTIGSTTVSLPQKDIWVGNSVSSITGPQHMPNGGNAYYYAITSGNLGNVSYQWSITPSVPFTASGPNMDVNFPYTNGDYTIKLTTTNSCGSTVKYHYVATGEYEPYRVYPNPSSDMVYVDLNKTSGDASMASMAQLKVTDQVSGELYNYLGIMVNRVSFDNGKASFSVRHLSKGVYVLKIHINDRQVSHRIVVN